MGLFDGQIERLGTTIVNNLNGRADTIELSLKDGTLNAGESFIAKATIMSLRETAAVIKASTEK